VKRRERERREEREVREEREKRRERERAMSKAAYALTCVLAHPCPPFREI
jgi:hypothetical protein